VIGKFPSIKNGIMVWWESQLERDYHYLLEIDPDVISYQAQPVKIEYFSEGKIHTYTPDVRVTRSGRKQIVEVKDEKKAKREEYVNLFRKIEPICREEGYEFVVVTDKEIRIQPRLNNVKFIYKYAKTPVTTEHQILLYSMFEDRTTMSLAEIIKGFASKGLRAATVYALIFRGILSADFLQPINPGSEVRLSLALPDSRRTCHENAQICKGTEDRHGRKGILCGAKHSRRAAAA